MVLPARCLLAVVALLATAPLAAAPSHPPYKAVEVSLPAPSTDKALAALREQLAAIVERKDRAALARLVTAKEFFWESDVGGLFNAKKSGFDNLATALRLADADSRGWRDLASFATEVASGPTLEHPRAQCVPAQPNYDDADLATLTDATNTDVMDWSYPRQKDLAVHEAASADAATIETLPLVLVRVLGTDPSGWTRIVMPSGKVGYVPPRTLRSPLANRLCFGKEATGWRITGYVGTGN